MLDQLAVKPSYGQRVSSVEQVSLSPHVCFPDLPSSPHWPDFPLMKVSVGEHEEFFGHVVSTCTFSDLRTIDTERVPMTYKQRQATRTLTYGAAVKVGIKFKSRWWEKNGLNQFGASSYTDRQCRVVVYPSAGLGEDGPGVLMATYSWCVSFDVHVYE
jgi:monoamine oxidase